jgi:murein DD-endopeptidase MepM/ murein hydrolase activator NlpD
MIYRVRISLRIALCIAVLAVGVACQPDLDTPTPYSIPSTSIPAITPTNTANRFLVERTDHIQEEVTFNNLDSDYVLPETTAEPEPISFPAPQVVSLSTWRPALYPAPLALTTYDHFYLSSPFSANDVPWPVEDYRYGGSFFEDVVHSGMDIKIPEGTPVLAAGPGKVIWAGYGLLSGRFDIDDPYGKAVMIRHNFGFQGSHIYSVYAHLDRVDVFRDQHVETGEVIGLSGETGKTSGPHLHFEVRLKKDDFFSTRNPELWLVPPQGWGVLAGRVMNTGGRKLEGQLVTVHTKGDERFWRAFSYHGGKNINSDPYYQENLVISDLPAGQYEIEINYLSKIYTLDIEIRPGMVSYFSFRGRSGYTSESPPLPGSDFEPPQFP